jgi:hypothetical protein
MSPTGDADLLVAARSALLDALDALSEHRDALVLIGAQAVYLHTGAAPTALAEATKDSDLALDPRVLRDSPLLDDAMRVAGFHRDLQDPQPGSWLSPNGIPVDLMVPEALAGGSGRRSVRIPPHGPQVARRATGLEAVMVDHAPMAISALDPDDHRSAEIKVAGPAALLIAKLHKVGERQDHPARLIDKDAHDIYRLLVATDSDTLGRRIVDLCADELAGIVATRAVAYLEQLFASGPDALGSMMAGRAEQLVGDPAVVSAAAAALASDVVSVSALPSPTRRVRN